MKPAQDWQGTPYERVDCGDCGSVLEGPVSRMPWLEHQHRDRCREATQDERDYRKRTGRWPARRVPIYGKKKSKNKC